MYMCMYVGSVRFIQESCSVAFVHQTWMERDTTDVRVDWQKSMTEVAVNFKRDPRERNA